MHVPFPPPPRTSGELFEAVVAGVGDLPPGSRLPWRPVSLGGLDAAWVGVQPSDPRLGDVPRPWTWDVVTPADKERDPLLRRDPLAVGLPQDVVLASIVRPPEPPLVTLRVPVREAPTQVQVDATALPPHPWRVDVSTGWTVPAIAAALAGWAVEVLGRRDLDVEGDEPDAAVDDAASRFEVGDGVWLSDAAFDRLLAHGPDVAAMACGALAAVCEALEPWR